MSNPLRGTGRRGLRAAALCLALLTGCTSSITGHPTAADRSGSTTPSAPAPSATLPPPAALSMQDCTSDVEKHVGATQFGRRSIGWDCGTLTVPLDYSDPNAGGLDMAVVRARLGDQPDRIGSLLVNPGGPGAPGTDLVLNLAYDLPLEVLQSFDLIGFDPRGVNFSDPIDCVSDSWLDGYFGAEPYVRDAAEFAIQAGLADQVATACYDKYGDRLGLFDTTNTARDMDQLRAALGDERLSYLGYSYGTTLGSEYAELFPDRVRALVLDGATNPTLDVKAATEAQARGFQSAFEAFAAACVAQNPCAAGPDPAATFQQVLDAARVQPLPVSGAGDRTLPVGLVFTGVLSSLYDAARWPLLASALGAAVDGEGTGLASLADGYTSRRPDGSYPNEVEANLAVSCADTAQTYTDEEVKTFIEQLRGRYPLFGAPVAASLLFCDRWLAPRTPLPERDAAGAAPILVVGTTNDPATPYSGAQAMSRQLDSGVLLTWDGEGHTAYPKTKCISAAVDAYLIRLTVPVDDTCPSG